MTDLLTANERIKAAGNQCRIHLRGELAYLEATLPLKTGEGKKQQRIPLGKIPLTEAEYKAGQLGRQLRTRTFDWEEWSPEKKERLDVGDFRAAGRKLYDKKFKNETSWQKKWRPALNKLPADSVLISDALLVAVVESMKEGTAGRRDQANILSQIAHSLKMDGAAVQEAGRGYTASKVEKRDIPTDEHIEQLYKRIELPHWRWTYGMCATYGLRPHEIVECFIDKEGNCHIGDATKTGYHIAWPVHQRWLKEFNLGEMHRPSQDVTTVARSANLYLHQRGPVPFPLYALRHAYAIRLFQKGVPSDIGAKLMGHSEQVHRDCYQKWYEAKKITELRNQFQL